MIENRPSPTESPQSRAAWLLRRVARLLVGVLLGVAIFFGWFAFNEREHSFLRQQPPDFPATGTWINADRPLNLANLRGKVVLVQFSFVGCGFCRLMDPYLSKWQEQFGEDGLVVVEVDDGNADTLDEVREWAAKDMIPYPVYYDAEGAMTADYGIQSYPRRFLIDRDGKVAWEGGGWGGDEGVATNESAIRKALGRE